MKISSLTIFVIASGLLFTGCVSNESVELGGAPAWIAGGAKLDDEPEPFKPDPALLSFKEESAPVELRIVTDKKKYETPTVKKTTSKPSSDPLERGRDYRIKRLFR
ncbi:MAG: hypothetical protein P1U68_16365 [Verrucomicrobiales bacterium]|nr:hypothetical protein [Verrucomicrobiales bacterium]